MKQYGWTQTHFAKIAAKNKYNGSLNPFAQYQKPLSVEEILHSRLICWPLTLYMCSTMADGAAAAIVCSKEMAVKLASKTPISVAACILRSGEVTGEDDGQRRAAIEAYDMAGIGPEDVEVVEVHDAMAPGELFRIEKLGFCKPEDMGVLVDEDFFALNGKLPVNPSGGLAARGHPIGATGLAQITELVWQMRGEAGPRQVQGRHQRVPKWDWPKTAGAMLKGFQQP